MASSLLTSPEQVSGKCSAYTEILLKISSSLSSEDLSMFKLFLCAEKYMKQDLIDDIKNSADLIRTLSNERFVSGSDVRQLCNMLRCIGRLDLASLAEKYQDQTTKEMVDRRSCKSSCAATKAWSSGTEVDGKQGKTRSACGSNSKAKGRQADDCPSVGGKAVEIHLPMSVDDDPDSQSSSQQSNMSMTDEEKLEELGQKCLEYDSQDLFD